MFYEERIVCGVWEYRTSPDGSWRTGRLADLSPSLNRPAAEVAGGVAVEPVAWAVKDAETGQLWAADLSQTTAQHIADESNDLIVPLYATPTPRPVGLSEEERASLERVEEYCRDHFAGITSQAKVLCALVRRLTN